MKKNAGKYLKFYKECMRNGRMPTHGLCNNFKKSEYLSLFIPIGAEIKELKSAVYWAADTYMDYYYSFGPTRQNIVLLMAAMNNEL